MWLARRPRAPGAARGAELHDRLVLLAYVVPYLFVLGVYGETYERFVLPVLPFFACFAAWGASVAVSRAGAWRAFGLALAALGWALPLVSSARLVWLRTRPDTFELAARWVTENVQPETERVLLPEGRLRVRFRTADGWTGETSVTVPSQAAIEFTLSPP